MVWVCGRGCEEGTNPSRDGAFRCRYPYRRTNPPRHPSGRSRETRTRPAHRRAAAEKLRREGRPLLRLVGEVLDRRPSRTPKNLEANRLMDPWSVLGCERLGAATQSSAAEPASAHSALVDLVEIAAEVGAGDFV
jgi:hypothetical protein